MNIAYRVARRLQFLDHLVPLSWRVPLRFHVLRACGGLEPEMPLLPTLVPPGSTAIDVGANMGTYTYPLSKLARKVIVIEPIPECAEAIRAWARNGNVEVHQCGLGDKSGKLKLHLPRIMGRLATTRASFSRSSATGVDRVVPITTLDSLDIGEIGFMKIDVEGFEFRVLKGGEKTLRRWHPVLLIEIRLEDHPTNGLTRVFEWLTELGYMSYYADSGRLKRCDPHIGDERPDIYNFIFVHEGDGRTLEDVCW